MSASSRFLPISGESHRRPFAHGVREGSDSSLSGCRREDRESPLSRTKDIPEERSSEHDFWNDGGDHSSSSRFPASSRPSDWGEQRYKDQRSPRRCIYSPLPLFSRTNSGTRCVGSGGTAQSHFTQTFVCAEGLATCQRTYCRCRTSRSSPK